MAGPNDVAINLEGTTAGFFQVGVDGIRIYAPSATPPTDPAPASGDMYYDTASGWREYNGASWGGFGGGISEIQHKTLRHLIHFIDDGPAEGFTSGAFKEIVGGNFPTNVTWWESSSKLKKIVEKIITRSGGGATNVKPNPIKWKIYDTDGSTVLYTITDTITYSGVFETSRTRAIVVGDV